MKKFGTFNGVFIPSFEAILGAVLFILLPILVADIGLIPAAIIILVSNFVTISTTFSIGDCASNLQNVGAGGMYAVSKRSLGKAFGGSIGIQLFLAQAASIGFYAITFATPLQEIFLAIEPIRQFFTTNGFTILQQKQLIATGIALIGFIAGLVGADFVVKLQFIIFLILIVSVGAFFVAPFLGITNPETGEAVFNPGTWNLWGGQVKGIPSYAFFFALTTFFPAVTGIDAGVGMSGSLKDPRRSLSRGTFFAIGITLIVYLGLATVFSWLNPAPLYVADPGDPATVLPSVTALFAGNTLIYVLLVAGILFATGSSALSYFMTAPRTAQALANDNLLPGFLGFLGKDFTAQGKEPRFATILTLAISLVVIWSGDVGISSRIVGIMFLVVYGWINLAAFFERISGNPSFRPTTKGHWSISLFGFVLSMTIIALDNLWVGLGVLLSQLLIFYLLLRFKSENKLEGVWWGLVFGFISWGMKQIKKIIQGTKNWRPMVGVFAFADALDASASALEIGNRISKLKGMTLVNILTGKGVALPVQDSAEEQGLEARDWALQPGFPPDAHIIEVQNEQFSVAMTSVVQTALPGGFHLNTILLPLDKRLNLSKLIENLIALEKNVLLYKHGERTSFGENRIDIWWKGEINGNLMALLSFIIKESDREQGREVPAIRFLRKLGADEDSADALEEMNELIRASRLEAKVVIISGDEKSFPETLKAQSGDAALVLLGMPGKKTGSLAKMFSLDKMFFENTLKSYDGMPPILFVKAARVMSLIEE
jgi:amino acid transporter